MKSLSPRQQFVVHSVTSIPLKAPNILKNILIVQAVWTVFVLPGICVIENYKRVSEKNLK